MSRVWICGDPGSTHDGSLEKALDLVNIAADAGLDAVKFQLLTYEQIVEKKEEWRAPDTLRRTERTTGNVMLPWEWLPELMARGKERGVEVFASVFDKAGIDWLVECKSKSIKFAYSSTPLFWTHVTSHGGRFDRTFASYDVMNLDASDPSFKLYCVPIYPVPYIIDFEGIFQRFDGFSSHCLGIQQEINAVRAGARYLEFHFQGNWKSPTPDGKFAKSPELTRKLVQAIRDLEMPYHPHDGRLQHGPLLQPLGRSEFPVAHGMNTTEALGKLRGLGCQVDVTMDCYLVYRGNAAASEPWFHFIDDNGKVGKVYPA